MPAIATGANAGNRNVLFDATNSPPVVAEGGGEGWVYNPNTGELLPNTVATDESGTAYTTY